MVLIEGNGIVVFGLDHWRKCLEVVQRLPVRLELDEVDLNRRLFSGISVTARVDTGYRHTWRHSLQAVLATEAAK